MDEAVILSAVRTPIGKYAGALKDVRPDDLAALVIAEAVQRAGVPKEGIEDVIMGCANQAGEDNRNVARMALLLAGLPISVAGQTVNRLCGSGLQAVNSAAQAIQTGAGDLFVAGGVESMTRAPFVMGKPDAAFPRSLPSLQDTTIGWRFINPRLSEMHYPYSMGRRQKTLPKPGMSAALIRTPTRWRATSAPSLPSARGASAMRLSPSLCPRKRAKRSSLILMSSRAPIRAWKSWRR